MTNYDDPRATMRMLPYVALATGAVLLVPVALVWWLRAAGVVTSDWACMGLAMVLSVVVSGVGSACWKRREGCEGVVFSDLLLWGWIRRVRMERQLANAAKLLGLTSGRAAPGSEEAADPERRAELLEALATALDAQDPYTDGHSRRVARHAAMVARELRLGEEQGQRIRSAGAVHDVGKLRIPAGLLTKPEQLTEDEFEIVRRHATEGAVMVAPLGDPELEAIVRHHHERWDGAGYPSGLHGANIPIGARIIAVADTFDAITSIRPYRAGARHKQALEVLVREAGSQLDPAVVRAFLRYYTGRKGSVARAALAVIPQRVFAWMNGNMRPAGSVSFGELAATTSGVLTAGLAALGAAAAVGVAHAGLKRQPSPGQVAALSPPAAGAAAGAGNATSGGSSGAAGAGAGGNRTGALGGSGLAPSGVGAAPGSRGIQLTGGQVHPGGGPAGGAGGSPPTAPGPGRHGPSGGAGGGSGAGSGGGSGRNASGGSGGAPGGAGGGAPPASVPTGGSGGAVGAGPSGTGTPGAPASPAGGPSGGPAGGPTGTGTPDNPAPPASGSSGGGTEAPAGNPGGSTGGPRSGPTTKDQCKDGRYAQWGFKNQGQCIASLNRP